MFGFFQNKHQSIYCLLKGNLSIKALSLEQFKTFFSVTYISHLAFQNFGIYTLAKKQSSFPEGDLNIENQWLSHLHKKAILKGTVERCIIKWINPQIGYGLFAGKDLEQNNFIGEYTGILKKKGLIFDNTNDYCFSYSKAPSFFNKLTIDSQYHGNETRFINHSTTPNLEPISLYINGIFRIIYKTLRPIRYNEELTFDYGKKYWKKKKPIIL